MIRVTITSAEFDVADEALNLHHPDNTNDYIVVERIRAKLGDANESKAVSLTNKEANVLMDALNQTDVPETTTLFEKLTGRVKS